MMSSAEQLRAEIAAAQRELEIKQNEIAQADVEIEQSKVRQRLRRELERIRSECAARAHIIGSKRASVSLIDRDCDGDDLPEEGIRFLVPRKSKGEDDCCPNPRGGWSLDCSADVVTGNYVWDIAGFSWLVNNIEQEGDGHVETDSFVVGGESFIFKYSPRPTSIVGTLRVDESSRGQTGSLVITHDCNDDCCGITFRYKIMVKNKAGDFVQWGQTGNECYPGYNAKGQAFGPDVFPYEGIRESVTSSRRGEHGCPFGVFGLSHDQLLESEWVVDDVLTVKFELQVRKDIGYNEHELQRLPALPKPTLSPDLLSLLESGRYTDVSFVVQGESVKAHSLVLCSRSEVFDKLLNSGMRESLSKEIVIEDCDVECFKALLRFLYTDDLDCVQQALCAACDRGVAASISNSGSSASNTRDDRIGPKIRTVMLQNLLSLCHRYQVARLHAWCEHELRTHIGEASVCSLLCQAHLFEAKQLEKLCLAYIMKHLKSLMVTPEFGALGAEWPAVMLKISLHMADVAETSATAAFEAQRTLQQPKPSKRKRAE